MKPIWFGQIDIGMVHWSLKEKSNVLLPIEFRKITDQIWQELQNNNPNLYNGHLVRLLNYQSISQSPLSKHLSLILGNIRFSQIASLHQYMERLGNNSLDNHEFNFERSKWIGQLGFKVALVTHDDSILLGRRSLQSEYHPAKYSLPGGIFEQEDLKSQIADACHREITEELGVDLTYIAMRAISLFWNIEGWGLQLLTKIRVDDKIIDHINSHILQNTLPDLQSEWLQGSLQWLPISKIEQLPQAEILEGLQFIKYFGI